MCSFSLYGCVDVPLGAKYTSAGDGVWEDRQNPCPQSSFILRVCL